MGTLGRWFGREKRRGETTAEGAPPAELSAETVDAMVRALGEPPALARLAGAQLLREQAARGVCHDTGCNQPVASICDVCTKRLCRHHAVLVRAGDGTMRAVCAGTRHFASRMPLLREITLLLANVAAAAGGELAQAAGAAQALIEAAALDDLTGGTYEAVDLALEASMRALGEAAKRTGSWHWERAGDLWLRAEATRDLLARAHATPPPAA